MVNFFISFHGPDISFAFGRTSPELLLNPVTYFVRKFSCSLIGRD